MSEKTEQPTPQKLREARKKGQVAKSRLFSGAVVTFASLSALLATAGTFSGRLRELFSHLLSAPALLPGAALRECLEVAALGTLPVLATAFAAAGIVSAASAGFEFHPELLAPQSSRIDPLAGFKRLFSAKQLLEVGKALLVAALVGALFWCLVKEEAGTLLRAVRFDGAAAAGVPLTLLPTALLKCAALLLALGGGDFLLARRRHLRDLMMTREEVKQEHKNSEGDPHNKSKRKSLHRQLAQGGPARGVQKATAIVVNPTHIAVALRYCPEECEAPYLVAKGREEDALALRQQGNSLGVPVVRDIPLARALVHFDVGEEVPEELYRAAAAVLRVAMEQRDADNHPRSRTS